MGEDLTEEAQRVADALDQLPGADPAHEARAISEVLQLQKERAPQLTERRRELIRELRETGMSLRKIAAEAKVSLGTVQDALRGYSKSWEARPRKTDAAPTDTPQ